MTASKHLKQLVRARMVRTGESYTAARRHLVARATGTGLIPAFVIDAHGRHGQTVAFSADGALLGSGGQDAAVRFWDPARGAPAFALTGHEHGVTDLLLTARGTAVSASTDRTVRVWDIVARTTRHVLTGHRDTVTTLSPTGDPSVVVSSGYDGTVRWWDIAAGAPLRVVRTRLRRVADLVAVPASGHLLAAGAGPEVIVHDLRTGDEVAAIDAGDRAVIGLAASPDGALVAGAGYDGGVHLWAAPGWDLVRRVDVGARASAVDISTDGHLLAVAWDHHVGVWTSDADTPAVTAAVPIKGVYAVAFSPDGTRLAQTGADGRVRCWRLR